MKQNLFFLLLFSATFFACDQDDDPVPSSNEDVSTVSDFLMESGLTISLLMDDGDNETLDFEGYIFNFGSDDLVEATNSSETVSGTYSVFRDDGRIELRMNFPNTQRFSELNDDWYFISIDQNTIRFDDDGDVLEFQQL